MFQLPIGLYQVGLGRRGHEVTATFLIYAEGGELMVTYVVRHPAKLCAFMGFTVDGSCGARDPV